MFDDSEVEVVEFIPKQIKNNNSKNEVEIQTDDIIFSNVGIQSYRTKETETQSDPLNVEVREVEFDEKKLNIFLNKIENRMTEVIKMAYKSTAFSNYKCPHEESNQVLREQKTILNDLESSVSCLDWNSSGFLIAATFCKTFHEGFCTHESELRAWNVAKEYKSSTKKFQHCLKLNSCGSTLKFHPNNGSLLVVGCYSGEVLVCSLQDEGSTITATTALCESQGHFKFVIDIFWFCEDPRDKILTYSADSIIIFWAVDLNENKISCLNLIDIGQHIIGDLTRMIHYDNELLCGTSFGDLMRIHWDFKTFADKKTWETEKSTNFKSHRNSIVGLRKRVNSPLFISICSRGQVRLYNLHKPSPVQLVDLGEIATTFDFIEPRLSIVGLSNGAVVLLSLGQDSPDFCETFAHGSPVSFVKVSSYLDQVATSDVEGCIKLWKLSLK